MEKSQKLLTQLPGWWSFVLITALSFIFFIAVSTPLGFLADMENPLFPLLIGMTSLISFSILTYLFGFRWGPITLKDWGLKPFRWEPVWLLWAVGATVLLLPLRGLVGYLSQQLLSGNMESIEARSQLIAPNANIDTFILSFLGVAIIAPIAEELFFRGLLHTWLQKGDVKVWIRVMTSSFVFALFHFDSIGVAFSSFILGVIAAAIYEQTNSLLTSVIVHMTTNSIAIVLVFVGMWAENIMV